MSNELSAQDLLPPEIGLTLLGFGKSEQGCSSEPKVAPARSALGAEHSRPLATVVTGGNCKIFGSRQAGGAAIAVESMAMPAELGAAHHRRDKLPTAFICWAAGRG